MARLTQCVACAGILFLFAPAASAQWVTFTNETTTRLVCDSALAANDLEEKDYASADFDHDGDVDLVIVRKQPFSTAGRKRNVLLMNEGVEDGHAVDGLLIDRTLQYASAADDGGQGFLDLTADRDVIVVDVDGDGWLDLVTATTYGSGLPKSVSHPRVYMNLGEAGGEWQGFRYEEARFPNLGAAPNFCGVGAGDVTGNKAPDLYFVDYDSGVSSPYDDRLLINDGTGNFTDQSTARMTSTMLSSGFGTTAHIFDMNGDGWLDVVKSENGPVKTHYNSGSGFFTSMQNTYGGAAYHSTVGDLNGDGRMDIVVSDDGTDRALINTGNAPNGQAQFQQVAFPPQSGGFGGNSKIVDLNNDGHNDVIICDVDVDAPGCSRVTRMYRNSGATIPAFLDQGFGGIPQSVMTGVHDVTAIDINRDGWLDLVIGKCTGTQIWMSVPPAGISFGYPSGLPGFVTPDQPTTTNVQLTAISGGSIMPGSGKVHISVNGGPFVEQSMTDLGGNLYQAALPALPCPEGVKYYFSARLTNNTLFTDPGDAPANSYTTIAALGTQITLNDNIEGPVTNWTVVNDPALTSGAWEQADPNFTIFSGFLAAPDDDAAAGPETVKAFVTLNSPPGAAAGAWDVDGGPTHLISPIIDLGGTDATITYARWFYTSSVGNEDFMQVSVSNDNGATWTPVHNVGWTSNGTNTDWEVVTFTVGDYVTPTSTVRVRYSVTDAVPATVVEAGIDNFTVQEVICVATCAADLSGDGAVGVADLLAVISAWGPGSGHADIAPPGGDGEVGVADLLAVINSWGACP